MAQGKLKAKAKVPKDLKVKKSKKQGGAVTKRANCPVQPKKKTDEARKLKQIITKTVNKSVEDEIRAKAPSSSNQKLSRAQQAVAEYHTKSTNSS